MYDLLVIPLLSDTSDVLCRVDLHGELVFMDWHCASFCFVQTKMDSLLQCFQHEGDLLEELSQLGGIICSQFIWLLENDQRFESVCLSSLYLSSSMTVFSVVIKSKSMLW